MTKKNGHFELPLRTALLKFEGEYEGAEMCCHLDVPLVLYFELQSLADAEDLEKMKDAMRRFGDEVLISTNIRVRGKEITPDADGLMSLPLPFVTQIFRAWSDAIQAESAVPLVEST